MSNRMPEQLIEAEVNIENYPEIAPIENSLEVTLGDLHASALKLLYVLVRHGILAIDEQQYQSFVEIYKTPHHLVTSELIQRFDDIVNSLPVTNKNIMLRLIGDETCDRGMNDYFVLKLLEKLQTESIPYRILASNHGINFLKKYDNYEQGGLFYRPNFDPQYEQFEYSSRGLQYLLRQGIISKKRFLDLVKTAYHPALKLLDYSIDPTGDEIIIFSHACIDIEVIECAAVKLGVLFQDNSTIELASTINFINAAFAKHVTNRTLNSLGRDETVGDSDPAKQFPLSDINAVDYIIWNRLALMLNRSEKHKGYFTRYVHGHTLTKHEEDHVLSLDNLLSRCLNSNTGTYNALIRVSAPLVLENLMRCITNWVENQFNVPALLPLLDNYSPEERQKAIEAIAEQFPEIMQASTPTTQTISAAPIPQATAGTNPHSFWDPSRAASSTDHNQNSYHDKLIDDPNHLDPYHLADKYLEEILGGFP